MNSITHMLPDRRFIAAIWALGLPIAIQNLISSCLNMVDTIIIGRLGETQLAAVGLANQVFFFFSIFTFGICSGTNVFIAQYWGKNDETGIRRVNGLGTVISLSLALVFFIAGQFFTAPIMGLFSKDPEVIRQGSIFLRIISFTYPLFGINMSYSFAMRAIGQPRTPMVIGSIALAVNTVLNYLLVFGPFGLPRLGVAGTATATLIARIVELTLTLSYVYGRKTILAGPVREILKQRWDFIAQYLKHAGPVILNEGLWSMAMVMVMMAYSKLGTGSVAAVQISNTIANLFFVVIFGVANAAAILIGARVGAGDQELALTYSKKCITTSIILGTVTSLLIMLAAPIILLLFKVTPETYSVTLAVLRVLSGITLFRFINIIIIVGILRGGGDTKYSLAVDVGTLWFVGVPLAFLGAIVWHLPIYTVMALVAVEEILKVAAGLYRLRNRSWIKDVTVEAA